MFDLNKIDKNFDEDYENIKLTFTSRELAIWRFLTVVEDFTRIMYMNIGTSDPVSLSIQLDDIKYVYKFAINRIYRQFKSFPNTNLKLTTDKKSYLEYFDLVKKTLDYKRSVHLMSMLHSEIFTIKSKTNNHYHIHYKGDYHPNYNMLELMGINKPETDNFIKILITFYFNHSLIFLIEDMVNILSSNVHIKKRKIEYNFNIELFNEIIKLTGPLKRSSLNTEEFNYNWGDSELTLKLINSLIFRCLYHLLCIRVANIKYNFIGGFENSLVLVIKKTTLIHDLSLISNIKDTNKIKNFLEFLEFPHKLEKALNSDAALQPLFLHRESYFIPCFHIIESNIERNLMTLFARNIPKEFDKQSHIFEKKMVNQIEDLLENKFYKKNYKIRINKKDQEFDFILIDIINKKILIIELRWMIQPADPREVINKRNACKEKIKKIKDKKEFFKENIFELSKNLKIPLLHEYSIDGIIVIDGYSGLFTEDLLIPLVPIEIFKIALKNTKDFNHLYKSLCSLEWLPRKSEHFRLSSYELNNKDNIFQVPGLEILDNSSINYTKLLNIFFQNYQ